MATFKVSKVLSSLPGTLVADTLYLVRVRSGIDIYAVDSSGTVAYKTNAALGSEVTALTNVAGGVNVDLSKGDYFTLAMAANVSSLTFSNPPPAGIARTIDITPTQNGTGGWRFAFPSNFHFIGASDTTIKTAANKSTKIIATTLDGATTWQCSVGGVG